MEDKQEIFLPELFKTGFSLFKDLDPEKRSEQIDVIHYIEAISSQLEKDLGTTNLIDVIPFENNQFISDKKTINKLLMDFEAPKVEISKQKLNETQIKNITEYSMIEYKQSVEEWKRELEQNNRYIQNYVDEIANYSKRKNIILNTMDQYKIPECHIAQEIEKILEVGEFSLNRIDSGGITFVLNNDVINTLKNEKAGIDLRVNMGQYKFFIKWSGYRCYVKPYDRNIEVSGHTNPHLGDSGGICLGNMSELMEEAQRIKDIAQILEIAKQVISNYCEENPYQPLSRFAIASQQIQPNGKVLTNDSLDDVMESDGREEMLECYECGHESNQVILSNGHYEFDCDECDTYNEGEYHV